MFEQATLLNKTFDAVICPDWGLGFIPWVVSNKLPVIVHLHGSIGQIDFYDPRRGSELWSKLYLLAESSIFTYADALVTHSNQNISFWNERLLFKREIILVAPAISKKDLTFNNEIRKKNKTIALVIGRIQFWKGVIQLCEAIELLDDDIKDKILIYWVGRDTFYQSSSCNMDKYLSLKFPFIWNKIVLPVGEKSHKELENYYNEVDFAIVPSIWDMFNLTAVEHMINKKPIICSSGAGVSDFLKQTEGVMIFNNTPEGLSQSIKQLLTKNSEELAHMGATNYSYASKTFNSKNIFNQHNAVIEDVISSFIKSDDRVKMFDWLIPCVKPEPKTIAREALLSNWSLKEVSKLFINRIKLKFRG